MGIFDFITDPIKKVVGMPTSKDIKKQKKEINAQIKAYQQQTELTRQQLQAAKDQETAEKRRVEEKQIRALRRSNRSQGFLGTSLGTTNEEQPGASASLGG